MAKTRAARGSGKAVGSKPKSPTKAKTSRAERDRRYREKNREKRRASQKTQKRAARARARKVRQTIGRKAPELGQWQKAMQRMRDIARDAMGVDVTLGVDLLSPGVPDKFRGTPWAMRGDFKLGVQLDYSALSEVAQLWRDDRTLRKLIGRNRYTRMGVKYTGPIERGSKRLVTRTWTAAEIGPWDTTSSRLVTQTSPDVPNSVAIRYKETTVSMIQFWVSHSEGQEIFGGDEDDE